VPYVQHYYNHFVVVFDGYVSGPFTKDKTRRASSHNIGAEVNFKPEMQLTMKKAFLANRSSCTSLAVSWRKLVLKFNTVLVMQTMTLCQLNVPWQRGDQ